MPWLLVDIALGVVALVILTLGVLSTWRHIKALKATLERAQERVGPVKAALEAVPRHEEPRGRT